MEAGKSKVDVEDMRRLRSDPPTGLTNLSGRQTRPLAVVTHSILHISLRIFDIDRRIRFFGEISIISSILYTTSNSCKKRPGDARNIQRLL